MAKQFVVKAKENSIKGGQGVKTGLVVKPGQRLVITASPDDTWTCGAGQRTSNANGLGNPLGEELGFFVNKHAVFLYGSLVGSVDNGKTYFPVGTRLDMPILGPGKLSLWCWDSNNVDNSGEITATVDLVSA